MLAGKHPKNKATEIRGNFRTSHAKVIYQVHNRRCSSRSINQVHNRMCSGRSMGVALTQFQTDALNPKSSLVHKLTGEDTLFIPPTSFCISLCLESKTKEESCLPSHSCFSITFRPLLSASNSTQLCLSLMFSKMTGKTRHFYQS